MFGLFSRYYFVEKIPGSYNVSFIVRQKFLGTLWVGKISKILPGASNDFKDLNQRAILSYRLATLVGTAVPKTTIIKLNQISYSNEFFNFISQIHDATTQEGILLTEFKGIPLKDFLKTQKITDIINLKETLENIVFNLWIGNYDKKDSDYVIDQNGKSWSIDYNLMGIGFKDSDELALGGYARPYDFNNVKDIGWCVGGIILEELRTGKYPKNFFARILSKIENLSESQIKSVFEGIDIFRQGSTTNINQEFIKFLVNRRDQIKQKFSEWFDTGFPRT